MGEASDEVAPERETTQAQRQSASEGAGQTAVSVLRITPPVQGVALGAGPRAARPHDALPGNFLRDVGDGFVVAQGVEVVLVEGALSMEVQTRQGGRLAEVCYDGPHPHFEQLRQLLLVPVFGLWIAKIEDGVVYRRFAISAPNNVVSLYSFPVQVIAWVEVRK